jgi:hypothetical protein
MGFKFNTQIESNLINFVRCQKGNELLNFGVSCLEKGLRNLRNCALTYIIRVVRTGLSATRVFGDGSKQKQTKTTIKE